MSKRSGFYPCPVVDTAASNVVSQAGAVLLPAGCGPCNDAVVGPLDAGEVSISTASNSNAGRFGSKQAKLYLGSPATVAASAVAGEIVDPRTATVLDGGGR